MISKVLGLLVLLYSSQAQDCTDCPANAISDGTNCVCAPGYYEVFDLEVFQEVDDFSYSKYVAGTLMCARCPTGADCSASGTTINSVQAMPDYFAGLDGTNTIFYQCFNEHCLGAGTCSEGYVGSLCAECDDDLVLTSDYLCSDCGVTAWGVIVFLIDVALFMSVLVYYYRNVGTKKKILHSGFLKVLLSYCQVNVLVLWFTFDLGDQVVYLYKTMQEVISTGFVYIHYSCAFKSSSTSTLIIQTLMLIFVPCFLLGIQTLILYLLNRRTQPLQMQDEAGEGKEEEEASYVAIFTDKGLAMGSVMMFYMYPQLTTAAAELLRCEQLGKNDDDWYLGGDLSIRCYSGAHWAIIFFLWIPMVAVYIVGVPLLVLYILRTNLGAIEYLAGKGDIPSSMTDQEKTTLFATHIANLDDAAKEALDQNAQGFWVRWGFYMVGYEPGFAWWEMVVFARKVGMIGVAVVFAGDPLLQMMMSLLIIIVACVLHLKFRPFAMNELDNYETVSLVCTLCLFFFGALTEGEEYYRSWSQVASLLSAAVFYVYTVLFAVYIMRIECEEAGLIPKISGMEDNEFRPGEDEFVPPSKIEPDEV